MSSPVGARAEGAPQERPGGSKAALRRWRAPGALVLLILLGGAVIALIQRGPVVTGPLDPNDTGPFGTHALAALLTRRGQPVTRAVTAAGAAARARGGGTILVVTSPGLLRAGQLAALARAGGDLVIVAPGRAALAILSPGVSLAGMTPVRSIPPRCGLPAARLAGSAGLGGVTLAAPRGAWRCYPGGGGYPSLVRYSAGGRTITVLGTGSPLTNRNLARDGNAALALNLLDTAPRIVWLVPGPAGAAPAPAGGHRSLPGLIPRPAYLVAAELAIALLLAALWRMRRFGPLVAEPLPVIVRASETVEGHGRLYRARRARGRAAAALRAATLSRVTTRLGLPKPVQPEVICQELAARTGRGPGEVAAILFGPAPRDDTALVSLATDLDSLEGQVLTS